MAEEQISPMYLDKKGCWKLRRANENNIKIERIDKSLWRLLERYVKDEPWKAETVFVLGYQIKRLFKVLGYRKISGEPSVLNDEKILEIWDRSGSGYTWGAYTKGIAQAQRDADVLFYTGNKDEEAKDGKE